MALPCQCLLVCGCFRDLLCRILVGQCSTLSLACVQTGIFPPRLFPFFSFAVVFSLRLGVFLLCRVHRGKVCLLTLFSVTGATHSNICERKLVSDFTSFIVAGWQPENKNLSRFLILHLHFSSVYLSADVLRLGAVEWTEAKCLSAEH